MHYNQTRKYKLHIYPFFVTQATGVECEVPIFIIGPPNDTNKELKVGKFRLKDPRKPTAFWESNVAWVGTST